MGGDKKHKKEKHHKHKDKKEKHHKHQDKTKHETKKRKEYDSSDKEEIKRPKTEVADQIVDNTSTNINSPERITEEEGPSLPPGFQREIAKPPTAQRVYGPSIEDLKAAQTLEEEEEDYGPVIGPPEPTPELLEIAEQRNAMLESERENLRAEEWARVREGKGKEKKIEREEWMLSLPEGRTQATVTGPRQFSKHDSSSKMDKSWTEIPGKETSKKSAKAIEDVQEIWNQRKQARDEASMDQYLGKFKSERGKSLVDMHKETFNPKAQEGNQAPVGFMRPFDREKDLVVRRVDSSARDKLIQGARLLDSNFAHGSTKYA